MARSQKIPNEFMLNARSPDIKDTISAARRLTENPGWVIVLPDDLITKFAFHKDPVVSELILGIDLLTSRLSDRQLLCIALVVLRRCRKDDDAISTVHALTENEDAMRRLPGKTVELMHAIIDREMNAQDLLLKLEGLDAEQLEIKLRDPVEYVRLETAMKAIRRKLN